MGLMPFKTIFVPSGEDYSGRTAVRSSTCAALGLCGASHRLKHSGQLVLASQKKYRLACHAVYKIGHRPAGPRLGFSSLACPGGYAQRSGNVDVSLTAFI